MMGDINLGVSPITNTIYAGKSKPCKNNPNLREWIGEKQDVTDAAIGAVFEWFMANAKESGHYDITYKGTGFVLSMDKTEGANDE